MVHRFTFEWYRVKVGGNALIIVGEGERWVSYDSATQKTCIGGCIPWAIHQYGTWSRSRIGREEGTIGSTGEDDLRVETKLQAAATYPQ